MAIKSAGQSETPERGSPSRSTSNILNLRLAFGVALMCALNIVQAQPVITYSVSGSSGNYTLDFTVNNQTPGTQGQDIYFWGVYDPNGIVSGSPLAPGDYYQEPWSPYTESGDGSTTPLTYNDTWFENVTDILGGLHFLPTGTTLSGFDVLDTSVSAPTSVDYFAYGSDNGVDYTGPDNLGNAQNPLFEGVAEPAPEPTTLGLGGLAALAALAVGQRQPRLTDEVAP
jgi:hypothetical protein